MEIMVHHGAYRVPKGTPVLNLCFPAIEMAGYPYPMPTASRLHYPLISSRKMYCMPKINGWGKNGLKGKKISAQGMPWADCSLAYFFKSYFTTFIVCCEPSA